MGNLKKRLISLFLIAALLCCLPVSAGADSTGVCFTSVNDLLLDLSLSPVFYGSVPYVSASVFANFGIHYSYFASDLTAELYTESKQIFFDMDVGNAYDTNHTTYEASAVYRNGVAYVPVFWTCRYFGLTASLIAGNGNGDILRIKDGSEVLTDNRFLEAASQLMQSRYSEYYGVSDDQDTDTDSPDNKTSPSAVITLSFIGLPTDEILDDLDKYDLKACFFLTASEADENSDTLRRLVCSGHSIGIYCDGLPSEEVPAAADAIYRAAQIMPTLLTAPSSDETDCKEYAADNAMAFYSADYEVTASTSGSSAVTAAISSASSDYGLCFISAGESENILLSVMQYLTSNEYSVSAPRETGYQ